MSAALLTQLGQVLGCYHKTEQKSSRESSAELSRNSRNSPDQDAKVDGFPARCWCSGPLLAAAPRVKVELEYMTHMDREARELAARGQADIVRYCQMMRRVRGGL